MFLCHCPYYVCVYPPDVCVPLMCVPIMCVSIPLMCVSLLILWSEVCMFVSAGVCLRVFVSGMFVAMMCVSLVLMCVSVLCVLCVCGCVSGSQPAPERYKYLRDRCVRARAHVFSSPFAACVFIYLRACTLPLSLSLSLSLSLHTHTHTLTSPRCFSL